MDAIQIVMHMWCGFIFPMSHCTALDHLEWHHLVACSEIAAAPV
jgi:hypothetical protein